MSDRREVQFENLIELYKRDLKRHSEPDYHSNHSSSEQRDCDDVEINVCHVDPAPVCQR